MDLSSCQITVMLPVKNLERARRFYEEQLALPSGTERPDGKVVYRCGGTEIALLPRAEGTRAEHTALSFGVADIRAAVAMLEARSVGFADYDLPRLTTVGHVCVLGSEKAAWFTDPRGQHPVPARGSARAGRIEGRVRGRDPDSGTGRPEGRPASRGGRTRRPGQTRMNSVPWKTRRRRGPPRRCGCRSRD